MFTQPQSIMCRLKKMCNFDLLVMLKCLRRGRQESLVSPLLSMCQISLFTVLPHGAVGCRWLSTWRRRHFVCFLFTLLVSCSSHLTLWGCFLTWVFISYNSLRWRMCDVPLMLTSPLKTHFSALSSQCWMFLGNRAPVYSRPKIAALLLP